MTARVDPIHPDEALAAALIAAELASPERPVMSAIINKVCKAYPELSRVWVIVTVGHAINREPRLQ